MENTAKPKTTGQNMAIKLDFNGMLQCNIGKHGLDWQSVVNAAPKYRAAANKLEQKRHAMPWRDLPYNQTEVMETINEFAQKVRAEYEAFVVLGIGGSALGPIAVQQALCHTRHNELPKEKRNAPRFYVEDNIDPERMASLFDVIEVENTMFCVITKSGSTSETMSQFLYVADLLKQKLGADWQKNMVAITDENSGSLINIAKQNAIKTFFVPKGVGGRFSQLCPVGLLPAAVCGLDIAALIAGARYMDELCTTTDCMKNPAYIAAALEIAAMEKGCNISVVMPYADSLKFVADWYAQLWAESLGKKYDNNGNVVHTGQTPVKALGVTDQHSQLQLYTEGPYDKVVTFIAVEEYRSTVKIPRGFESAADVAFLGGHTFNELIDVERCATRYALNKSGHMNKTIILPKVNEFTIGQLLYFFELQTAFAGELLNINAFDQPGVEAGKKAAYAMLGKAGYEALAKELASAAKINADYVL